MKTTSPNPWLISQTVVFKGHLGLGQHIQMAYAPCAMATNISFMEFLLEFALRSDRDARIWLASTGRVGARARPIERIQPCPSTLECTAKRGLTGLEFFRRPDNPSLSLLHLTTDAEEVWVLVTHKHLRSFAELGFRH